jgi:hypothetical protein
MKNGEDYSTVFPFILELFRSKPYQFEWSDHVENHIGFVYIKCLYDYSLKLYKYVPKFL